jgi:hypothetical protein
MKDCIVEHAELLDLAARKAILHILMAALPSKDARGRVFIQTSSEKDGGIAINLDCIEDSGLLRSIYNVVKGRLATLNKPVHDGGLGF